MTDGLAIMTGMLEGKVETPSSFHRSNWIGHYANGTQTDGRSHLHYQIFRYYSSGLAMYMRNQGPVPTEEEGLSGA